MIWALVVCGILCAVSAYLIHRIKLTQTEGAAELSRIKDANGQLAAHAANYQQKLRAPSDSSGPGMIILDQQCKIIHTNSAVERILNVERDGVVGHSLIQATLSAELQEFVT